jgi:hypothetical protein
MIRNTVIILSASLVAVAIVAALAAVETTTIHDAGEAPMHPVFTNQEILEMASDEYLETPEEIIARYNSYQYSENPIVEYWERARLQQILPP